MDEWWNDFHLNGNLSKALDAAGWQGLTVWPGGMRSATLEDDKIDIATMRRLNVSRVRRDKHGLDIWMFSPAGAHELFIREGKPPVFLPLVDEKGNIEDIIKQIDVLGKQLRQGLLGEN